MRLKLTPEMLDAIKRAPDDAMLGEFVANGRLLAKPLEDATEMLHERIDQHGLVVTSNGTTITRKIVKGSYTVERPVEFFKAAKEILVSEERLAKVYSPSMTKLAEEIADTLSIPKSGKSPVTAQGIVDAQFKIFTTQSERRLLQFST